MTDVLDLHATRPPGAPKSRRSVVVSLRMTPGKLARLQQQADVEHTTVGHLLRAIVERDDLRYPPDVAEWLTYQAAQCGCPGDLDRALHEVVRHLAVRWPHGGRLDR